MRYMRCGLLIHGTTGYKGAVDFEVNSIGLVVSLILRDKGTLTVIRFPNVDTMFSKGQT